MGTDWLRHGLVEAREPSARQRDIMMQLFPGEREFQICNGLLADGKCGVGDVVMCIIDGSPRVAELCLVCSVQGKVICIIALWEETASAQWSMTLRAHDALHVVPISCVRTSMVYSKTGDQVVALKPPSYR